MTQHPTPLPARPARGRLAVFAAAMLAALPAAAPAQDSGNLDIYWIDVEGGAATSW